jgi:hypothetical protein
MIQMLLVVERAAAHRRLVLERDNLLSRCSAKRACSASAASTGDAVLSANAAGMLQIANPAAARLLAPAMPKAAWRKAACPSPVSADCQLAGSRRWPASRH